MVKYINLQYLSPISNFVFDTTTTKYVLIFFNSSHDSTIMHKITITDIDNITETIRAYSINRSFKLPCNTHFNVMLFAHSCKKIYLLFSGELNKLNNNNKKMNMLILKKPVTVGNKLLHTDYINMKSFLQETFFDLNKFDHNQQCIIFYTTTPKPSAPIIKPLHINVSDAYTTFTYDRYAKNFVTAGKYSLQKDKTIQRKIRFDPFSNNVIVAPVDGKLRAFKINSSTVLNINYRQYKISQLVEFSEIDNSHGYITEVGYDDYKYIHMPYSGKLKQIRCHNNITIFKFESQYFIPDSVSERDYLSVVNGNYTYGGVGVGAGTRAYPELIAPQPKITLIFYLILFQPINYTNKNLKQNNKFSDSYFQQGEEVGYCTQDTNYVAILANRPIEFASDIQLKNEANSTFIKAKDIVGILG